MNETKKYYTFMYAGWIIAAVAMWFLLSREPVHDNGGGASAVAGGIETAKEFVGQAQQQSNSIGAGIREAQASADRLAETQRNNGETVGKLAESVERCQQILNTVSARAEKDTKAPEASKGSL